LLFDALKTGQSAAEEIGIRVVELIAIRKKAKAFCMRYGFTELADDPLEALFKSGDCKGCAERSDLTGQVQGGRPDWFVWTGAVATGFLSVSEES